MNTFHYILIALVLLGFFFRGKDSNQTKEQSATTKKAAIIMTSVIIGLIVISAYW